MRFELDDSARYHSDEELIADLKRAAAALGKDTVTRREYEEEGQWSSKALIGRFGSWNAAIDAAGLHRNVTPNLSQGELFGNIEDVWIKLGRQPHYDEMRSPLSRYSASCYDKRFGSWRKALEAFVEYVNSETDAEETVPEENQAEPQPTHKTTRAISDRLRFLVFRRDNFKCVMCGRTPATDPGVELVVDHHEPWSKGGESEFDNLQTSCVECNSGKSNLTMEAE